MEDTREGTGDPNALVSYSPASWGEAGSEENDGSDEFSVVAAFSPSDEQAVLVSHHEQNDVQWLPQDGRIFSWYPASLGVAELGSHEEKTDIGPTSPVSWDQEWDELVGLPAASLGVVVLSSHEDKIDVGPTSPVSWNSDWDDLVDLDAGAFHSIDAKPPGSPTGHGETSFVDENRACASEGEVSRTRSYERARSAPPFAAADRSPGKRDSDATASERAFKRRKVAEHHKYDFACAPCPSGLVAMAPHPLMLWAPVMAHWLATHGEGFVVSTATDPSLPPASTVFSTPVAGASFTASDYPRPDAAPAFLLSPSPLALDMPVTAGGPSAQAREH